MRVDAESMTPERLPQLLRARGYLHSGSVVAITTTQTFESPTAYVYLLHPTYSSHASDHAPARLALKSYKHGVSSLLISREVTFYSVLVPSVSRLPIARCYAAEYDPETGIAYCLLEDRTMTHRAGTLTAIASEVQLRAVVEALAQLHAAFWNHPYVLHTLLPSTVEVFVDDFTYHRQRLNELSRALGNRLPVDWQAILSKFIDRAHDLQLARLTTQGDLTLAHSDPHLGNVLFPRNADADHALLIDFAFARTWWGSRDVAFALTFATDPPQRRAVESALVQHYHARLEQYGIKNYSREQCWHDYRMGVVANLRTVLGSRKEPYAWHRLERAIHAYIDLACDELLDHK